MEAIEQLADWIAKSNKITVLTGAGISTESGIPDFRSTNGFWNQNLPRERLMSLSFFNQNQKQFWRYYKEIFQTKLSGSWKPNSGHLFLSHLEKKGKNVSIFTQNVDGLHQAAGSQKVYEVHGSMHMAYCTHCGEEYDLSYINQEEVPTCHHVIEKENICNEYIPIGNHPHGFIDCPSCLTRHDIREVTQDFIRCKGLKKREIRCNHILKPDVVLFGDMIRYYQEARLSTISCDLFMVLGSSLKVGPINEIPILASGKSCKRVLITKDPTEMDDCFQIVLHEPIGEVISRLEKQLKSWE